jgi:hypothetical protein
LNGLLTPYTLHFGYRVFDEIVTFLSIAESNGMFAEIGGADPAFDAAVLMKVLPKFHGSRSKLERPLLAVLAWCVNPDAPDISSLEAANGDTTLSVVAPMLPRTAGRVERMLRELCTEGFTAFG